MLEEIRIDISKLLDMWSKKFNIAPLISTNYREELNYKEYENLGNTVCWYTIEKFIVDSDGILYDKTLKCYVYNGYFKITIESESREYNYNLDEFLLFLNNKSNTNLFFKYKTENEFKRKIRKATSLDNRNFYIKNKMYFKNVISFELHYEFRSKGDYYLWQ